jgi:hypothetical protein
VSNTLRPQGDDLLIRLEPGELRVWDFADDFA